MVRNRVPGRRSMGRHWYQAVPYELRADLSALAGRPEYPGLLQKVVAKYTSSSGTERSWLQKVFQQLSQHFRSPASKELLNQMIHSGVPDTISDAAGLFREAGLTTFLAQRDWVIEAIRCASNAGPECLEDVTSYLERSALADGKTGVVGEPFPADLRLKEEATKIAAGLRTASPERAFFERLAHAADREIARTLEEDDRLDD